MSSIQSGNAFTGFLIRLVAKNFPKLLRVQDLGLHLVTSLASTNYSVIGEPHDKRLIVANYKFGINDRLIFVRSFTSPEASDSAWIR